MQRLTKWGNSVGLRLPQSVREAAGLQAGCYVHVRLLDSGEVRLKPVHELQAVATETSGTVNVRGLEEW